MRDYAERIEKKDALQAHPEYLNEQINDHDKAIYAKGWNDCNKEYYNAITELPVASIDCTDLSMRLRRAFEADELVNQRILLDAADAIEELLDELTTIRKQLPHWISVEERLPEVGVDVLVTDGSNVCISRQVRYVSPTERFTFWSRDDIDLTHWMPLPAPPKGVE